MKPKRTFRRRKKVINPKFQLQLAGAAVIFLLLYSFVLGAAIFYPLAAEYASSSDSLYKTQLAFTALKVHESLWPALITISALAFIGTVLFSHRIAGPIYRFEKTVETLATGNFNIRIKLRKRDEFHDFADKINALAEYLNKRETEEQSFRCDCEQLLKQMSQMIKTQHADIGAALQPIVDELMTKYAASVQLENSQGPMSPDQGLGSDSNCMVKGS